VDGRKWPGAGITSRRAEENWMMAFKPNYNQQRAERNRLKQAKKEAKQREREEAVTRRKSEHEAAPSSEAVSPESRES